MKRTLQGLLERLRVWLRDALYLWRDWKNGNGRRNGGNGQ
jgi:hypothetical protein